MKIFNIFTFCISLIVFFSCTPEKKFVYLQKKDQKENQNASTEAKTVQYKIRPNDILYVKIIPNDQAYTVTATPQSNVASDMSIYFDSYNVSDSGIVTLPLLGKILVRDLTIDQFQSNIQKMVDVYLKNSLVIVKLVNFKVTILGEVNRPGTFRIYDTHINILDAIGLAGDLTINGSRKEIMLIRHSTPDKIVYLDLTDVNIINSDYYYLSPDDIIYIKPNKSKYFGTNPFPFATVLSAITTLLLLVSYLKIKI